MKHGFFVTGTDTNVGKTVVSAWLMTVLRRREKVCYWKPIQTGIEEDNDTETVKNLANCADSEILDKGYRLEKPFSPHLSARLANVHIEINNLLEIWRETSAKPFWIIEGAGGLFVPLNETEFVIDLIEKIDLPVIIAARSSLGTINHTLLTLESLRNRKIKIAGVILNGEPNEENKKAIEHYSKIKVLGELPHIKNLNFAQMQSFNADLEL